MDWNDVFEYRDGSLYWKIKTNRNMKIGRMAGSMAGNGYMQVHCFGKVRLMHRIIWEMHNGDIPEGMEIDHINHIRDDNRIENLRLVSRTQNAKNLSMRSDNTSNVVGVSWDNKSKKWYAKIAVNGKQIALGRFSNLSMAAECRKAAEEKYCFHKNHGALK